MKFVSRFVLLPLCLAAFSNVAAMPFGTFDPRTIAMGGAGVASATSANAVFYNPSLLSQYRVRKNKARNSRFVFPLISASVSQVAKDIYDIDKSEPDQKLSDAVTAFNADQSQANAQSVAQASKALQNDLAKVANESVNVDGIYGLAIGVGDRREGGAFVFSRRVVGDGMLRETAHDKQLANDYTEAMTFVATGGAEGSAHPELFDTNGNLLDQTDTLTSTATARGLILTELGVAMAWDVAMFKSDLAFGFTPKLVQGIAYEFRGDIANTTLVTDSKNNDDWRFTFDAGINKRLNPDLRAGLVVKNLLPMRFNTKGGDSIDIKPQLRGGLAYNSSWGLWAFDLDLLANDAIGSGGDTQYASLGGEWRFRPLILRAGYKRNLRGQGLAAKGVFTTGVQFRIIGIMVDLAYIDSGPEKAAALQLSQAF
jgi:hypothetical protein